MPKAPLRAATVGGCTDDIEWLLPDGMRHASPGTAQGSQDSGTAPPVLH